MKLTPGMIVEIHNLSHSGKPIIEGRARLMKFLAEATPGFERWHVRFLDEPDAVYMRTVATPSKVSV